MSDDNLENGTHLQLPRIHPDANFAQNLGAEMRRAAQKRPGYQTTTSFEDMVIEVRKLVSLLQRTLVPVSPRPLFTAKLEAELRELALEQVVIRQQRRVWLVIGGIVGSILSILGVITAFLFLRRREPAS